MERRLQQTTVKERGNDALASRWEDVRKTLMTPEERAAEGMACIQKAVIYARYSPGPNQREESIEGQFRECTEFAKKMDTRLLAYTQTGQQAAAQTTGRNFSGRLKIPKKACLTESSSGKLTVLAVTVRRLLSGSGIQSRPRWS